MKKYKIRKYLSEYQQEIKKILKIKGKKLLIAPTGSGKTYTVIDILKELSKEDKETVYIFTVPNTVQAEQLDHSTHNIYAMYQGHCDCIDENIFACTYDQLKKVKEHYSNYKFCIVVDEAHNKIYQKNFRKTALEYINNIEEIADSILHITATPNILLSTYKYDEIYNFESTGSKGIELLNIVISKENRKYDLLTLIQQAKEKNNIPVVWFNNVDELEKTQEFLNQKNINAGFISSNEKVKNNDIDNSIINDEMLPTGYDCFLCTSKISAGTNIQNENVAPIFFAEYNTINTDEIIQFISRFRKGVKVAYVISSSDKERKFLSRKAIEKQFDYNVKLELLAMEEAYNHVKKLNRDNKYIKAMVKAYGKVDLHGNKSNCNCIRVEEDGKPYIDEELFQSEVEKKYQEQLYFNPKKLKEELLKYNKAENICISKLAINLISEEDKQIIKTINTLSEEVNKNKIQCVVNQSNNNDIQNWSIIVDESAKDYLSVNDLKALNVINSNSVNKKLVYTLVDNDFENDKINECLLMSTKDKNNLIKELNIKQFNISNELCSISIEKVNRCKSHKDIKAIMLYRYIFDKTCKYQTKIYNKNLKLLYEELLERKLIKEKSFDKAVQILYQNLLLIYNITSKNNITSLKK